jgi:DNA repair exonuclease SbcCD ATPase subunit
MTDYSVRIAKAQGIRQQLETTRKKEIADKEASALRLIAYEKAQALLQGVASDTQSALRVHIEDIVQLALDSIFPNQYQFNIRFDIAYGRTSANLVFTSKISGFEIDPLTASGGGVVDVCSFALRLACWTLSKGLDSVIILDEPFRFLSRELQGKAGVLLKELGDRLGLQIIMTTHLQPLAEVADKVFTVKQNNKGVSDVR